MGIAVMCVPWAVKAAVDKPSPEAFKEEIAGVSPQQGHSVQRPVDKLQANGLISTRLSVLPDARCLSLDHPEVCHMAQALCSVPFGT